MPINPEREKRSSALRFGWRRPQNLKHLKINKYIEYLGDNLFAAMFGMEGKNQLTW